MNFLESINTGIAKAIESGRQIKEVNSFFDELNEDLSNFDSAILKVTRTSSAASKILGIANTFSLPNSNREHTEQDQLTLHVKRRKEKNEGEGEGEGEGEFLQFTIAGWRQHIKGYPCSIKFEGDEYICYSKEDLKAAINELFASASFGKSLTNAIQSL